MSWGEAIYIISSIEDLLKAKLKCKSTASADEGKTITVTGSTGTYTATLDSNLEAVFTLKGQDTYTVTVTNGSTTEYTTKVYLPNGGYQELEVGLNKNTWQGIQNILNAHLENDYFTVGDSYPVTLNTGEIVYYRIAAINHDEAHQLIFEPQYCLETARQMNASNTNSGGWNACALRSWLNGSYLAMLPDDLQAVIAERVFQTSNGSQSSTLQTSSDKIWLPKEYEVLGAVIATATSEKTSTTSQFPIYATADNCMKTYGKSGGSANWWLSSPHISLSTGFAFIASKGTGGGSSVSPASTANGVAPSFQIVATS
jgi:hypothetical protein